MQRTLEGNSRLCCGFDFLKLKITFWSELPIILYFWRCSILVYVKEIIRYGTAALNGAHMVCMGLAFKQNRDFGISQFSEISKPGFGLRGYVVKDKFFPGFASYFLLPP